MAGDATIRAQNGDHLTIAGDLTGGFNLTTTGNGEITLGTCGANTYCGTTTIGGTGKLRIKHVNALGGGGTTVSTGTSLRIDIACGGTVSEALTIQDCGDGNNGAIWLQTSDVTLDQTVTMVCNSRIGVDPCRTLTISGAIGDGGGAYNLQKRKTGTLVLSGVNTYTGITDIDDGTVRAGAAACGQAFGICSAVVLENGCGATLDLNNFDQTIGSLAGGGACDGNVTLGSATLTVGGDGTSTTYSGAITGAGAVTKTGTGTLTFDGTTANTFTGLTTISAGVLQLDKTIGVNAIAGSITIESNATLRLLVGDQLDDACDMFLDGGTFSTGSGVGFTETLDNVTLSTYSIIDLGTGSHILYLDDLNLDGNNLNITGWEGSQGGSGTAGKIYVKSGGNISLGLHQSGINFTGFTYGFSAFDATGGYYQIVPQVLTPEPSTWFGGGILMLGTFAHYLWRRRVKSSNGPCVVYIR